ncbi:carbohydrate esterase family 3 protein [Sporormia fimetaria CBS 119925]|uniref:Carbohydrate esterase family 3 protein n=1 Tax=Sporormia fimetaria CBS 119925 TaxID=1340428 RepID=A0A6A6V2Y2_9PLEO|nr:carbohydrate esterase family 3 protein [Sporormia fimetaria CBS 119925]
MPFGDSITDYGCWRPWLGQKLQQTGFTVDFVGSQRSGENCVNLDYDRDHEGHPGHQAYNIARDKQLVEWLQLNPADVVTMHLGTVDIVRGNRSVGEILAALGMLVDQMRGTNERMRIIIAQIIPIPSADQAVRDLNSAIPAWAAQKNSTMSPIWVVDQWSGFDAGKDLYDGLHPSESGDEKIAERFYPAMVHAIRDIQGNRMMSGMYEM